MTSLWLMIGINDLIYFTTLSPGTTTTSRVEKNKDIHSYSREAYPVRKS